MPPEVGILRGLQGPNDGLQSSGLNCPPSSCNHPGVIPTADVADGGASVDADVWWPPAVGEQLAQGLEEAKVCGGLSCACILAEQSELPAQLRWPMLRCLRGRAVARGCLWLLPPKEMLCQLPDALGTIADAGLGLLFSRRFWATLHDPLLFLALPICDGGRSL